MKWSWKSFFIQLITLFAIALGVSYVVSKIIDGLRGPEAADSTILSMKIGGFLTSVLFSILSGWRRWDIKMMLVLTFLVTGLYSGNLAVSILIIPVAAASYWITGKLRDFISFYFAPVTASGDEPDPKD